MMNNLFQMKRWQQAVTRTSFTRGPSGLECMWRDVDTGRYSLTVRNLKTTLSQTEVILRKASCFLQRQAAGLSARLVLFKNCSVIGLQKMVR